MQTISIISLKGGAGKTTLAISLAVAAERSGKSAVLIDLDYHQATACKWKDRREADTPITIDALPARLTNTLQKASEGGIGLAVIDTPAGAANPQAIIAAAKASDLVVIPICPQAFDLETLPGTLELLRLAGEPPALVVLNDIPPRGNRHEQTINSIRKTGTPICPAMLTHRSAPFGDAALLGLTVLEHKPKDKAALEVQEVYKYINRVLSNSKTRKSANAESRLVKRAG